MIPTIRRPHWQYFEIAELIQAGVLDIGDGYRAKNAEMGTLGLPFARAGNVNEGFHFQDADILCEASVRLAGDKLSQPGDIAFTSKGTFGRFALVRQETPQFVYSPQLCYWRVKREGVVDRDFLYYWMQGTDCMNQLKEVKGLTDMADYVSLTNQRRMWLSAPSLPEQRRIAGILSAYDDLIENNRRRIQTLEEMARALYREWFVHFRFPGYEKIKRVASPLGDIPRNWQIKCFPECVEVNPHVVVARDGEHRFVPMGSLANDSMLITDIESRVGNSGAKFQNGDTIFARITPCLENGKTGFVQFLPDSKAVAHGSTEFIVLRSRSLTPEFVYLLARTEEFRGNAIKSMTGASGRQRVQEQCFDGFQIAHPSRDVLDRFSAVVAPSFRLIQGLQMQTQNLRRTRDLLLPQLLSGRVNLETD